MNQYLYIGSGDLERDWLIFNRYDTSGNWIGHWGIRGSGAQEGFCCWGVDVAPVENPTMITTDWFCCRLQEWSLDGRWIGTIQNHLRSDAQSFKCKNKGAETQNLYQTVHLEAGTYTLQFLAFTNGQQVTQDDVEAYAPGNPTGSYDDYVLTTITNDPRAVHVGLPRLGNLHRRCRRLVRYRGSGQSGQDRLHCIPNLLPQLTPRGATMRKISLIAAMLTALQSNSAPSATWYVDASVPSSGNGNSWETAFKTIQEGIEAASHGDSVIVAKGVYKESIRFSGKNITLTSTGPLDPGVVANTIIGGVGADVVSFDGTEDGTCTLSGFTISGGYVGVWGGWEQSCRATIQNSVITGNRSDFGAGVVRCDGAIRNNVIMRNHAMYEGGGLANCNGLIENNLIAENCVGLWCPRPYSGARSPTPTQEYPEIYKGAGLYRCNGVIRNNIIVRNRATEYNWGVGWAIGCGGGLAECNGIIEGNLISGNVAEDGDGGGLYVCNGMIRNNTITGNRAWGAGGLAAGGTIRSCIIWGNTSIDGSPQHIGNAPTFSCIQGWTRGGEGNITEEPRFVDAESGDFRLRADSPCIDAGFNDPDLPEFDIAGIHRIMFGGKSLTVDMGVYEFYINRLEPVPGTNEAVFTWSSLADKTYSIFYTHDLLTWRLAISAFPSSGNETTSWIDDGSLTGQAPLLVPRRFYRTVENAQ